MADLNKRELYIKARVNQEEKLAIEKHAKEAGMIVSDYVRIRTLSENRDVNSTERTEGNDKDDNRRSLRIYVNQDEYDEITRQAKESGVSRNVFVKNRIINGSQTFINAQIDIDALNTICEELHYLNDCNNGILKVIRITGNNFTDLEKENIADNSKKILEATREIIRTLWAINLKVNIAARKEVQRLLKKQKNNKNPAKS